jgi:dihydrofolate synthase/folylpolyglutamate synthase
VIVDRLDPERVGVVAGGLELHGRMEVVEGDPPVILDAAHNPAGATALVEALPAVAGGRPIVGCIATLADKDGAGILAALAPQLGALVTTEIPAARLESVGRPGARSIEPAELARLAQVAGIADVESSSDPADAVERARELAGERGAVALVFGSHYLLRYATHN